MLRHVPYFNFNMGYLASRGAIPNAFQQMQLGTMSTYTSMYYVLYVECNIYVCNMYV